ncbi:Fur-regulated basic protein FbpA [Mesobacillus foraminis]|uniref:Fur-regulated basic protein A n=1 Tax=Mesobacillus foraminis TaxID=279826 RepID=A0A4R2BFY8_9BACI|nr:Fur-regulated basic protein FbpA [Mesobacillus foraminis]TCN25921.1 Fur-regulated basic protein A [Mesobacillus foraminis]
MFTEVEKLAEQKKAAHNNLEQLEKDILIEQLISMGIFKSGNSQLFELSVTDLRKEYEQYSKNEQ